MTVESGEAALRLVSDSLASQPGALILVGTSLGGAIRMRCFPEWTGRASADLVVAQSTFPSYRVAARSALSKSWVTWMLQPLTYLLISDSRFAMEMDPAQLSHAVPGHRLQGRSRRRPRFDERRLRTRWTAQMALGMGQLRTYPDLQIPYRPGQISHFGRQSIHFPRGRPCAMTD